MKESSGRDECLSKTRDKSKSTYWEEQKGEDAKRTQSKLNEISKTRGVGWCVERAQKIIPGQPGRTNTPPGGMDKQHRAIGHIPKCEGTRLWIVTPTLPTGAQFVTADFQ